MERPPPPRFELTQESAGPVAAGVCAEMRETEDGVGRVCTEGGAGRGCADGAEGAAGSEAGLPLPLRETEGGAGRTCAEGEAVSRATLMWLLRETEGGAGESWTGLGEPMTTPGDGPPL